MIEAVEKSTEDKVCRECGKTHPYNKYQYKSKQFVEARDEWVIYRSNQCDDCRAVERRAKYTPDKGRKGNLSRYKITLEEYDAMLEKQGGGCAVCGSKDPKNPKGTKHLVVDHCHELSKVRGLLCSPCNIAAGMLADDPARAIMLSEYLKDHQDV